MYSNQSQQQHDYHRSSISSISASHTSPPLPPPGSGMSRTSSSQELHQQYLQQQHYQHQNQYHQQHQNHPQLNPPPPTQSPHPPPTPPPCGIGQHYPILQGFSSEQNGRIFSIEVIQQPIRARMCGFGDKDRRPITPPPCVRLVVKDAVTGDELDINEVEISHYVLSVDLWSADGTREVNLVRHSATSPSISATTSSSFLPLIPSTPSSTPPPHSPAHPPQKQHQFHHGYSQQLPVAYQTFAAAPPMPSQPHHQLPPPPPAPSQQNQYYSSSVSGPAPPHSSAQQTPQGMFTRNLIGSLTASAFKLADPSNKLGVWFILQDLSVRTEGLFRLKMNFFNLGLRGGDLNTGVAPVLASAYSDVFQVYSAKKFPGVIESTPLSKCFATQGIKIPIRRDKGEGVDF